MLRSVFSVNYDDLDDIVLDKKCLKYELFHGPITDHPTTEAGKKLTLVDAVRECEKSFVEHRHPLSVLHAFRRLFVPLALSFQVCHNDLI